MSDFVNQSITIIKERVACLSDDTLHALDITTPARDYFCQQPIILEPDDSTLAAIDISSYTAKDKSIKPFIIYHPALNHSDNQVVSLKYMAHECGHALIQKDNLAMQCAHVLPPILKPLRYIINPLYVFNVVDFLDTSLSKAESFLPSLSRQDERKADRIADALVPEYTLKDAYTDIHAYFIRNNLSTHVLEAKEYKNPALHMLFATHPVTTERYEASEKNCRKFAAHSLLWS